MGDEDGARQGGAEITELGPRAEVDSLWRRRPWLVVLLVVCLGAAIGVVLVRSGDMFSGATGSTGSTGTSSASSSAAEWLSPGTVRETVVGNPLLGVQAGWELYGRGPGEVVRIRFAHGRIVRTGVPGLPGSGPVSFVTGAHGALVCATGVLPGYAIPDGQGLSKLPSTLCGGGRVFPGPDPDHVWVASGRDAEPDSVALVRTVDGHRTGVRLDVPAGASADAAIPDQRGYLVFSTDTGVYEVTPHHSTRVTTGRLLAVGPTRWLVAERDSRGGWVLTLVNRANGARQPLRTGTYVNMNQLTLQGGSPGVISPDGTKAAVPVGSRSAKEVVLVDMVAGFTYQLSTYMAPGESATTWQTMVWSPDSTWLFLAVDGHVNAVNPHNVESIDLTEALPGPLPSVLQLSMR